MTGISAVGASTPTVSGPDGTKFSGSIDRTAMNQDMFLKLLVAQLQYQDPSKPVDSSEFLAQSAQFTAVEQMTKLSELTQKVLDASLTQSATGMVGKTVSYTDAGGNARTGLVTACTVGAKTPNLTVNGLQVPLTSVTSVASTGPGTPTPAPAS